MSMRMWIKLAKVFSLKNKYGADSVSKGLTETFVQFHENCNL